jgi:phospholipid-binding lipoprotein MlaA
MGNLPQIGIAFPDLIGDISPICEARWLAAEPEEEETASMRRTNRIFCALALLSVAGCATPPQDPAARAAFEEANDPLEPMNRQIFAANDKFDQLLLRPVGQAYRSAIPEGVRKMLRNLLNNLDEPVVIANNTLQGEFGRAGRSFVRLGFNSVFGIAGLFDICSEFGLKPEKGDFGQTLYAWGAPEGPYLILPIFGPSTPRDVTGLVADAYIDPFRRVVANPDPDGSFLRSPDTVRTAADGIDRRAGAIDELDEVRKNSLDYYAQLRSLWRQNRAKELRHGEPATDQASTTPDLYDDPATKTLSESVKPKS